MQQSAVYRCALHFSTRRRLRWMVDMLPLSVSHESGHSPGRLYDLPLPLQMQSMLRISSCSSETCPQTIMPTESTFGTLANQPTHHEMTCDYTFDLSTSTFVQSLAIAWTQFRLQHTDRREVVKAGRLSGWSGYQGSMHVILENLPRARSVRNRSRK